MHVVGPLKFEENFTEIQVRIESACGSKLKQI
jgi:hypothetical protein